MGNRVHGYIKFCLASELVKDGKRIKRPRSKKREACIESKE